MKTATFLIVCSLLSASSKTEEDCNDTYTKLKNRILDIQSKCGEVCNTDIKPSSSGKYFDIVKKNFQCETLFEIKEGSSEFYLPPRKIPKFLRKYYSYGNRIPISDVYMSDMPSKPYEERWRKEYIEDLQKAFRENRLMGSYGLASVHDIAQMLREHGNTENARALVIGSQSPWVEAILLEMNVKEIVTLEYSEIRCTHPKISTILPEKLNKDFLSGELKPFDLIFSFSSLEHSGLGRYGDPLNPWGDLITMAKTWCMTKDGGRAIIGVPTGINDEVIFNAAKIYGPIQYSHLFANWKPVYSNSNPDMYYIDSCKWCYQPLFVVEK